MFKLPFHRSRHLQWAQVKSLSTAVATGAPASKEEVVIPKRIPRGPTDILQALSGTISRDPTAAHYKYHDDPFLIPLSNINKRSYALAQEAGRKAAKWIVNENSQLFHHKVADPPIEVFAPKVVYDENSKVEESTLLSVIEEGHVADAVLIYDLLQKAGTELSTEAKQALLELVCFTNEEEGVGEDLIEERWFSTSQRRKSVDVIPKTWRDNGLAETLFKTMSPATPEAHSAMIQGMVKFGQLEKAWQTLEQAWEKEIRLDVGAYNAVLSVVNGLKQSSDLRWQLIQELLARMATEKVRPDLNTLNACLLSISGMGGADAVRNALKCFAEFRQMAITPSLASYYYLLHTIYRDRMNNVNQGKVLSDILDRLENKSLEIQHPADTKFFVKAMEICRHSAHDPQLARRVHALLHHGDNYNLIGDSFEESVYYRHFFFLLCATEPIESVMELYDDIVPNIYTPEPAVTQELLKAADLSGAVDLLPQLWTDIVAFDQTDRELVLCQLLETMVRNEPQPGSPLVSTFADIATSIWEKVENQDANRTNRITWSGEMLSNILILWSRSKQLEQSAKVMSLLGNEQAYVGEPTIDALCVYMDLCVENNDFDKAMKCISFCKETGRAEAASMAKDIRSRLSLTDEQAQQLERLLL